MKKITWLVVAIFLGAISSFAEDAPHGDVTGISNDTGRMGTGAPAH